MPPSDQTSGYGEMTIDRWVRRSADVSTRRALRSTTRASIYEYLQRVGEGQTVRDVADRFNLHPNVARTHLETLADAGLVVVSSRKHPGGGRPAKVYLARAEAGSDEIRVHAPVSGTSSPGPVALVRLLGEVIVNGQGPQGGRLESLRQAAMKEGTRLAERSDEPSTSLAEAAETVARALRADGYQMQVHQADDTRALVSRVGGALEVLRPVRGGLASALEWGLLTGAFTKLWRPVQVTPLAESGAGEAGWVIRLASVSPSASRLMVTVAGRVDARNAPRETGVVRAMRAITSLESGAVLEVLAGGPGSPAAFARWADRAGHELIGVERATDDQGVAAIRLLIRKGRS